MGDPATRKPMPASLTKAVEGHAPDARTVGRGYVPDARETGVAGRLHAPDARETKSRRGRSPDLRA
jgi:hypothetical protein